MSLKKNIPNTLSTIRLFMALLIPFVFPGLSLSSKLLYFLTGNATDALDGYLARKWEVQSRYGKIVDPIADKSFNLLSLLFASLTINPLLLGIVIGEATIAAITSLHTISNIKSKNIDMSKLNLPSKTKLFIETAYGLNVSRIGRKKAILMTASVAIALLSSLVPALVFPASLLIAFTTIVEIPVITKYATEYYIDCKNYKIESSIECNATKRDLEKLKKAKEKLEKYKKIDQCSDMLDEKIIQKFKKEHKFENEEYAPALTDIDEVAENDVIDDKAYTKTYKH